MRGLFYRFAWGRPLVKLPKVGLALEVENSFVLLVVQISFVLSMLIDDTSLVNIQKTCCHIEQLMQWLDLMLKGLAM
jgi:hypothetical protein